MTCPKVGDIVYWHGDDGPTWVLILEQDGVWKDHFTVLPLAGNFQDETEEWRLGETNKVSWEVLA